MSSLPIELSVSNPYSLGKILDYPDGTSELIRGPLVYIPSLGDIKYPISQDDTIWNIAYRAYGSSRWWWVIAEVNDLINPFDLVIGDFLIIPELKSLKANQL